MKALALNLDGRLQEMAVRRNTIMSAWKALAFAALAAAASACGGVRTEHISASTQNIPLQQFRIDGAQGGVVVGQHGAIFAIPPGAFMDEMGNTVSGPVSFRFKEANTDLDILVGGLVTRSGQDMLATGGMYMVEALADGKALRLNPAVGIYASLPTTKKDAAMGLYKGSLTDSKLDWKLTGQSEQGIPACDRDKASRALCKKCERLAKMASRIKPGKKPDPNTEYWAKRHVWENGKLYFYSSGSRQPVLSQEQLDECASYLSASDKGQQLLAIVDQYKAEWKDRIGDYYAYRMDELGWYNIDRLVKEELVELAGRVVDQDGKPVPGAKVHLYCQDEDMKVHILTTAEDGSYMLRFAKGRNVLLFAYEQGRLGKTKARVSSAGQDMGDLAIVQIDPENAAGFLEDVL